MDRIGKIFIVVILAISLTNIVIAFAATINSDDLAKNDLKDENGKSDDLGKVSREDYKKQHPGEDPSIDEYYYKGEKDIMHDTANRAITAKKAARYQRPKCGYLGGNHFSGPVEGDCAPPAIAPNEEIIGGGIYLKNFPAKDEDIVKNVWRFAEDLLWPKNAGPSGTVDESDDTKFNLFAGVNLDIGKRLPEAQRNGWYCIENALFLSSILRELGYKVQYKNTIPSYATDVWGIQTAAVNVWYNGSWHFYDPWKSIDNIDDYLINPGNDDTGIPFHDYITFKRVIPIKSEDDFSARTPDEEIPLGQEAEKIFKDTANDWKLHKRNSTDGAATKNGTNVTPVWREQLVDSSGRITGWPGTFSDPYNPNAPRPLTAIPLSAYYDPDSLTANRMGNTSQVSFHPRGYELLSWQFNNSAEEIRNYTLRIINPTNDSILYSIDIKIDTVNRNVTLLSPSSNINGTLTANETQEINLSFDISAPHPEAPAPVQDLHITISGNVEQQYITLSWSPSQGANNYSVYRCTGTTIPITIANLSSCSRTSGNTQNNYTEPEPNPGDYFYAVTAVNSVGESDLDPSESSVEAISISPPPAGQNIGPIDTNLSYLGESDCRNCHNSTYLGGVPTRHHYLVQSGKYNCQNCHPSVNISGGQSVLLERNCIECHNGTAWRGNSTGVNMSRPHHIKPVAAQTRQCNKCHGSLVSNFDDGHYVPTYGTSEITPYADNKIYNASSNRYWGGCIACHQADPDSRIISNYDTHHSAILGNDNGIDHQADKTMGVECRWCHVVDNTTGDVTRLVAQVGQGGPLNELSTQYPYGRIMELRNSSIDPINGVSCEKCHSVQSIHNIQWNYSTTNGHKGYGHIGDNWDCNGCHAFWDAGTASPYQGAIIPDVNSITPSVLIAGTENVISIEGTNFLQDNYTTNVSVDDVNYTPTLITDSEIIVTIPALTPGVHDIKVMKGDSTSKLYTLTVSTLVNINGVKLKSGMITITGSGFGVKPVQNAQEYITINHAGNISYSQNIVSWSNTQIKTRSSIATIGDIITVTIPTGAASAQIK